MINKELSDLIKTIEIEDEVDTQDNYAIKEYYNRKPSQAIALVLKENRGYYYQIVSSFNKVTDAFISGAVLDAINEALANYTLGENDSTYIVLSGTILRNMIAKRRDYLICLKRGGEESDISFDYMKLKGFDFDKKSFLEWEWHKGNFREVELLDYIKKHDDLTNRQKEIGEEIIKSDGKIRQKDLSNKFGVTQPTISYHISKIENAIKDL